jgi:sec-independent protein translocase protein TatC
MRNSMNSAIQEEVLEGENPSEASSLSTFLEKMSAHLVELRLVAVRSFSAFLIAFCVAYYFSDSIIHFMEQPLLKVLPPGEKNLYYMGLMEKFFVYMQWSAYAGALAVSPFILFQVWNFISPGLYPKERKIVKNFLLAAVVAFLLGITVSYFLVLPYTFKFLITFGSATEKAMINLSQYLSFSAQLILATAFLCELPVFIVLLGCLGVVKADTLAKYRRQAHIGLSVVAAVITPMPDALSMILVCIPLSLFFEASILIIRLIRKQSARS